MITLSDYRRPQEVRRIGMESRKTGPPPRRSRRTTARALADPVLDDRIGQASRQPLSTGAYNS